MFSLKICRRHKKYPFSCQDFSKTGIKENAKNLKIGVDKRVKLNCFLLVMKVAASLSSLKSRHPACKVVRRKGRVYVINKVAPRFKARQG